MIVTITELSALTNKTRPTLYKYMTLYNSGNLNEIPYSLIKLFELINKPTVSKKEVIDYCQDNFINIDSDQEFNNFVSYLKGKKNQLDYEKIKNFIEAGGKK